MSLRITLPATIIWLALRLVSHLAFGVGIEISAVLIAPTTAITPRRCRASA